MRKWRERCEKLDRVGEKVLFGRVMAHTNAFFVKLMGVRMNHVILDWNCSTTDNYYNYKIISCSIFLILYKHNNAFIYNRSDTNACIHLNI